MRLIRVTYRATFQQPKQGPLNPMGLKIHFALFVEVYQTGVSSTSGWGARTITNTHQTSEPWPIQHGATADQMRANVIAAFETQLTPWEMWGNPSTKLDSPRLLQPEEVEIRENGQVYFKDPPKEPKK
jgi:hypothetical protein